MTTNEQIRIVAMARNIINELMMCDDGEFVDIITSAIFNGDEQALDIIDEW